MLTAARSCARCAGLSGADSCGSRGSPAGGTGRSPRPRSKVPRASCTAAIYTEPANRTRRPIMPADARGHVRRLPSGKWQLRYYDADGARRSGGIFPTRTAAFAHFRNTVEPRINGEEPTLELTLAELVDVYLERHAQLRSTSTIRTLRHRLARPLAAFVAVPLRKLEGMA